jgi:hypothetical protein
MNALVNIAKPRVDVQVEKNTLKQLLKRNLTLPPYQRRYCWGEQQIMPLLNDIDQLLSTAQLNHQTEQQVPLFLGTVILHQQNAVQSVSFDLVDGQQRLLTLNLLIIALQQYIQGKGCGVDVYQLLEVESPSLLIAKFSHRQAQQQLAKNFKQIKVFIQDKPWASDRGLLSHLLTQLEFVVITIHSIDQAFAFFDSQNSAGKRLSDFDLLKARHLRGVVSEPAVGIGCSRIWEEYEKLKLNGCYGHRLAYYLTEKIIGRTRLRQRNKPVDTLQLEQEYPVLTRDHQAKAKQDSLAEPFLVSLSPKSNSPLYRDWRVSYNANEKQAFPFTFSTELQLGGANKLSYGFNDVTQLPLQMNQPLVDGEQFFIFIAKYVELYKQLFSSDILVEQEGNGTDTVKAEAEDSIQECLLKKHRRLEYRQGLGYPRLIQAWQALVIFYVDRFGVDDNFAAFVRLSDQYIFSLRILLHPLRRDSVENNLLEAGVFSQLLQSPTSNAVLEFIDKLIEARSKDKELVSKLMTKLKGVRSYYLNSFYWHEGGTTESHQGWDNSLSRLLKQHAPEKCREKDLVDA